MQLTKQHKDKLQALGLEAQSIEPDSSLRIGLIADRNNMVTDQALEPDNNYIRVPFRALSASVLPYRHIDFSADVLKRAVDKFSNVKIYPNHNPSATNWLGKTASATWDEGSENMPAGVNVDMMIYAGDDMMSDPTTKKVVIGLREGLIDSCSVGIAFDWQKSHPKLDGWSFWELLGNEVDGEIVRIIVTEIIEIYEVSLVWEGADPNAKRLQLERNEQFEELEKKYEALKQANDITIIGYEEVKRQLESANAELAIERQHYEKEIEKLFELNFSVPGKEYHTRIMSLMSLADLKKHKEELEELIDQKLPLTCPKCGDKLTRRSSVTSTDTNNTTDLSGQFKPR